MRKILSSNSGKKLIYVSLLSIWIEFICFISLVIIAKKIPNSVYIPPSKINKNLDKNLSDSLGWGSENIQTSSNYELLDNKRCRIHLFGDSYMEANTYQNIPAGDGTKSTPEDLLSKLSGCAVLNHSVGGYGSDQAYLKFLKKISDSSIRRNDIVVLSHLTENILRNANRNRNLLYIRDSSPLLKPKFKVEDEKLKLISIPKILDSKTLQDLKTKNYPAYLRIGEDRRFIPRASFGSPSLISFPYSLNLLGALTSWHLFPRLINNQRHAPFYSKNSESYKVTIEIIKSFHDKCVEIGCKSLSIDLPLSVDFGRYFVNGKNLFPLTSDLINSGVDHISIGELQSKVYPQLLTDSCFLHEGSSDGGDACNGHYNQKGYSSFFKELAFVLKKKFLTTGETALQGIDAN